jgi:hypothetical protein
MNKIEMQYIGAAAVLGRVSHLCREDTNAMYSIKRAMDDCAAAFPGRFEVIRTSNGGYSLEPIFAAPEPASAPVAGRRRRNAARRERVSQNLVETMQGIMGDKKP